MRKLFPGYYPPSDEEFKKLWAEAIFVFDTNVLLDLYRYSEETAVDLILTMEGLKERIWIPHRVAFEYHRKLNDIIVKQALEYTTAIKTLEKFNKSFQEKRSHPFLKNELHDEIESFTKKFDGELKNKQQVIQGLLNSNPTKEKLADIIDSNVGSPFSEEELKAIYEEGEKRYKESIPPGYEDKSKPGYERYGDLVIWKEICRKASESEKPIVFVTGDNKEDWFQIVMGMTVGPRPELIEELKSLKDILFYIYSTPVFLRRAKEDLNIEIKEGTLNEIEEVSNASRAAMESVSSEECETADSIESVNSTVKQELDSIENSKADSDNTNEAVGEDEVNGAL